MEEVKKSGKRLPLILLSIFLILGMLTALLLVYEHFAESTAFCPEGETLDCGVVNKSPYANLDGFLYMLRYDAGWGWVPDLNIASQHFILDLITSNALLGFLTLLLILLIMVFMAKGKKFLWIKPHQAKAWVIGILIFGIIYGIYLFFVQHFILNKYCIYCIALDLLMVASLITAFTIKKKEVHEI